MASSPHRFHSTLAAKSTLDCNRRSFSRNTSVAKPSTIVDQPRSFNPTSSNSHSEFGRRNSISKEDYEHKENESDLINRKRLRSPSVSKSTKNFMSPTISATIKSTPLPKRNVLLDRNENHSVSSNPYSPSDYGDLGFKSDVKLKTLCNPRDAESEADQNSLPFSKGVNVRSKVPFRSPNFSESDSEFVDRKETIYRSLSSKLLYERDASPLPYNPKTNYLSPRPRFLYYKPNSEIQEGVVSRGCKGLDDTYNLSEDSEKMESEDSQDEYEDVIFVESVKEEDTTHWPSDASHSTDDVPEVKSFETKLFDDPMEAKCAPSVHFDAGSKCIPSQLFDNPMEEKYIPWFHFSARCKFISLLLIFLIACLLSISFTDPPVISSTSTLERHPVFTRLYQNPQTSIFSTTNLGGFTKSIQLWFAGRSLPLWSAASYISRFVGRFSEVENLDPLCYGNSTALLEDPFEEKVTFEIFMKNVEDGANVGHGNFANTEGGDFAKVEDADFANVEDGGELGNVEDGGDIVNVLEAEIIECQDVTEVPESDAEHKYGDFPTPKTEQIQIFNTPNVEDNGDLTNVDDTGVNVYEDAMTEVADDSLVPEPETVTDENHPYPNADQIEALNISVASGSEQQIQADEEPEILLACDIEEEKERAVAAIQASETHSELPEVAIGRGETDFDSVDARIFELDDKKLIVMTIFLLVLVTPCARMVIRATKSPSIQKKAFSPFQDSSYNKGSSKREMERHNRESLGSSLQFSTDSPSFGSFTTFEKMTCKHREEEILTPVRRSSRIRSHVTSP